MSKAIKRPVEIDFVRWAGTQTSLEECTNFLGDDFDKIVSERHPGGKCDIHIKTLEGVTVAARGDYIVRKDGGGDCCVCKPEAFGRGVCEAK